VIQPSAERYDVALARAVFASRGDRRSSACPLCRLGGGPCIEEGAESGRRDGRGASRRRDDGRGVRCAGGSRASLLDDNRLVVVLRRWRRRPTPIPAGPACRPSGRSSNLRGAALSPGWDFRGRSATLHAAPESIRAPRTERRIVRETNRDFDGRGPTPALTDLFGSRERAGGFAPAQRPAAGPGWATGRFDLSLTSCLSSTRCSLPIWGSPMLRRRADDGTGGRGLA